MILKRFYNKIARCFVKDWDIRCLRKNGCVIGQNVKLNDSFIDSGFSFLVEIGDNVTLSRASILAHDGSTQKVINLSRVGKVKIGNNVFIGYQSIIMPGVTIGDDTIIGAGSLVTHDIPQGVVAAGNPCRVLCSIEEYKQKHEKALLTHPIFDTYCHKKNEKQKKEENKKLENTWGYDL